MATYPGAVASLPTNKTDETTTAGDHAANHNSANAEIMAVQSELGPNPSGTHGTVADAIGAMLEAIDALETATGAQLDEPNTWTGTQSFNAANNDHSVGISAPVSMVGPGPFANAFVYIGDLPGIRFRRDGETEGIVAMHGGDEFCATNFVDPEDPDPTALTTQQFVTDAVAGGGGGGSPVPEVGDFEEADLELNWTGDLGWRLVEGGHMLELLIGAGGFSWSSSTDELSATIDYNDADVVGIGQVWHEGQGVYMPVKFNSGEIRIYRSASNGSIDPWQRIRIPLVQSVTES